MLQAVMTEPGKIEIREVERPIPQDDQVLIAVKRIGVCGSDIHVYHGLHPYTAYPVVQGHEVAGVVAEWGKHVTGFLPGDKVVFMPQVTCGVCYSCRHGMEHICDNLRVMGFQTGGAGQEFFAVDQSQVLKVPDHLSLDQAALIEPISVAVHAVRRAGGTQGKSVVVLGAGTIGNLVAQVARADGARVLITDVNPYKLEKARACGFEQVLNTAKDDLSDAIQRVFGADKADLIFECVGVQDTISAAVSTARKGSTIVVVGVFGKKPLVDLGLVQDRELSLVGTLMYQKVDYQRSIQLAADGKLCLDELVTDRFPFRRYLDAYHAIEQSGGNYLKVMVDLE